MSTESDRPNLPADTLFAERANLIGDCLSQIVFGAIVVIFLQTTYTLFNYPKRWRVKGNWFLIAYTFVLFTFAITFISVNMKWLQLMFIDHREHEGGPLGFSMTQYSEPAVSTANVVGVMCGWMADGYLALSTAMGSLFLYQALRPGASLFNHLSVNFGVPYFSLTAGLNVLISSLIVVQWLMFRREVKRVLGHDYAVFSPYVAAGPLLIESSLIYAVNSIIFVVPYGLGSHVANIFLPLQALAPVLSSMLIVHRVAMRRAWDSHTLTTSLTAIEARSRHPIQAAVNMEAYCDEKIRV
ncbi:hypothetical protein IW262DRAFT_1458770 [Armillaria fumosa]|nr:hypothetical protein IW262DRAFT_1458770 [Armillaria fumosa]